MFPRILKNNISFIVVCLLCACTPGPNYQRPKLFETAAVEKALDIKSKQTPTLPFQPQDLQDTTLNQLLTMALNETPDIRTALSRIQAARAERKSISAGMFPSLDTTQEYTYQKSSKNIGVTLNENAYQSALNFNWEIDLFGRTRRQLEAANANENEMINAFYNTQVSLISDISSAYISLRTAERLLSQAKEDLKIQNSLYNLTKDKYDSGLANAIDLNQAAYQKESTEASIPNLKQQIKTYQNTLTLLLGKLPGELDNELNAERKNLIDHPFDYPLDKLHELPASVIWLRPDVRMVEEQLIQQNAQLGGSISDLFPSVNLSAFLGFESLHFPKLFHNTSYSYGYNPKIQNALFHFGALWHNVEAQTALTEAAKTTYEKSVLTAAADIKNSLVALEQELERHMALDKAWQHMDKAAKLAREKYKGGLIDYFSVLDAEERRIAAQAELTTSSGTLYQNIINLYKAVGGQFAFNQSRLGTETE